MVEATKTWTRRIHRGGLTWHIRYKRYGSLAVKSAAWTTYYTRQHRWWLSSPWGTVKLMKQRSASGAWTRCVRKFYNMASHLKSVTYSYTQTGRCHLGRKYNINSGL